MKRARLVREMTQVAIEVGCVLNAVIDDEQRDELRDHFDRILNRELYAGSQNRAAVAPVVDLMSRLAPAPVIDIFSRRVD